MQPCSAPPQTHLSTAPGDLHAAQTDWIHHKLNFSPSIKSTSDCIRGTLKNAEHLFDKPYGNCPKVRVTILEKCGSLFK